MKDGGKLIDREIQINGRPRPCSARTLGELLEELGYGPDRRGIAVAVNGDVLPRGAWRDRRLNQGDAVEIVGAVQGG